MRMDYYQMEITSGTAIDAQMTCSVELSVMKVQCLEYLNATKDYQKAMEPEVVTFATKIEKYRSVKAQEEGGGQATAKKG